MKKPETTFQTQYGESLRLVYPTGFWRNLRDVKYAGQNPFDAIFIDLSNDVSLAMEFKKHDSRNAWYWKRLEPHQREGLAKAEAAGMTPWVIIRVKFDTVNFAACFHPGDITHSMRPEEMLEQARIIQYRRKIMTSQGLRTAWDVTQFGENIDRKSRLFETVA